MTKLKPPQTKWRNKNRKTNEQKYEDNINLTHFTTRFIDQHHL